tara:strand:- start:686 stop:1432 length:747 start_codon:yes stop_codon:yes gene_type:complete
LKNKLIRISKIISHAGICSRKDAEELIIKGYVKVNNKIFKEFFIRDDQIDSIKVRNKLISKKITRVWIFNKPIGFVSSNKEQFKQKSFFRLIPNHFPRMVSAGRLDINSDGLMVLTNNPNLTSFLESPENQITRKYLVKVFGKVPDNIEEITKKKLIIDGVIYSDVNIKVLTHKTNNNIMEILLKEGKNREIRKILNNYSLKVKKLTRVGFGPFKLNNIEPGRIVEQSKSELKKKFNLLNFKDENSLW